MDLFTWGLIIGYITGCISGVVFEALCVIASRSDNMMEEADDESCRSKEKTTTIRK